MKNTLSLAGLALILAAAPEAVASGGNGMTWSKLTHSNGVDLTSCDNCNAYAGDTACTMSRPILCLKPDGSPIPKGVPTDFYHGWAAGNIATTPPVPGTSLTSLAAANAICSAMLGAGWRMAEHHDGGGGWGWYAYGNVRPDLRAWVYINDQPANCWNP